MVDIELYIGKRIVLTSKNEIAYAGEPIEVANIRGTNGIIVQLDSDSGFSIWCPLDYIKDILVVPIPK